MLIGVDIKNEDLKAAISDIRGGSKEEADRNKFLGSLICGKFIVPATIDPKPEVNEKGEIHSKGKYKINFHIITNKDKQSFFPCYTDDEEYEKGTESKNTLNSEKVVLTYKELAQMVQSSKGKIAGLVINPFGMPMPVNASLIDRLEQSKNAGPVSKETLKPNSKIKLRTPKYMPVDMLEKACEILKEEPEVEAAYMQMIEKEDSEDEYLIVIDTEGDVQGIFAKLAPELKEYSFGLKVAFTPAENPLGQKVIELTEPFYTKTSME